MSRKRGKVGNPGSRFHSTPLSPAVGSALGEDDNDEEAMNKSLKEAGLYEDGLTPDDKKAMMKVLHDSKEQHAQEEEERRQRQQQQQHSSKLHSIKVSSNPQSPVESDNQSVTRASSKSDLSPAQQLKSEPSPGRFTTEDESSDSEGTCHKLSKLKELSVCLVRIKHEQVIDEPPLETSTAQSSYSSLQTCGEEQETSAKQCIFDSKLEEDCSDKISCSLKNQSDSQDISDDDSEDIAMFSETTKKHLVNKSSVKEDNTQKGSPSGGIEPLNSLGTFHNIHEDSMLTKQQEELDISSSSSVSSVVSTSSVLKTIHGNLIAEVSPLQNIAETRAIESYPLHLRGLEKFRGDKALWLSEAKKASTGVRFAHYKEVLAKNPKWKDSISETANNLKSLFKRPTFSGLFSDSGSSFASKQRVNNSYAEHSGRPVWPFSTSSKSLQARREENDDMNPEEITSSEEYDKKSVDHKLKPENSNRLVEHSNMSQNSWDDVIASHSLRSDKKVKYFDGEVDSPTVAGTDVYDFDEKSEGDNDWKPAVVNKRRNSKKNGKSNSDSDFEVQVKPPQRGRGTQGKKSRGARVVRRELSRPSEHLHQVNNSDTQNEQFEAQALDENQANNEKSSWLSKETAQARENCNSGTAPAAFYPLRKSRNVNRNQDLTSMRNNQHIAAQNNKMYESTEDTNVSARSVACPICNGQFQEADIEAHASGCQEFQTVGEGVLQQDESGSGGDHIEVITNVHQPTTGPMPSSPLTCDSSPTQQCQICLEQGTSAELTIHFQECHQKNLVPLTGQKRASSEDEGPARKTTRKLSLAKKS